MYTKISKTLEGAIARTIFTTSKASLRDSLKDCLFVELMRERGSLAYQILAAHLTEPQIARVVMNIEREVALRDALAADGETPADFFTGYAEQLRRSNGDVRHISTAHALLEIISDGTTATAAALADEGVTREVVVAEIERFSKGEPSERKRAVRLLDYDDSTPHQSHPLLLDKFAQNLTQLAREGRLDPVIGRDAEIERVIQILARRKKNNPILIGEAGVGKSAIVEALALRMAQGSVPIAISDKELYSLEVSSLVAGTKFRGEFEERIQQILDELRANGNVVLFIDEIHTIVGAGATQGALDTANILKPALARGELQTIGATTLDEYREQIERDSALERRFQRVIIEPPTAQQTLDILRKIAPHYENHHRVSYTDEALSRCVSLADRYITDRHFPDKAIDLMDEAGSRTHIGTAAYPEEIRSLQESLDEARRMRREAAESLNYEAAAAARLHEIAIRAKLGEAHDMWQQQLDANPTQVGVEHIEQAVTAMTGIPAERIAGDEVERLRHLREYLEQRVIGQSHAVERISDAIRRSRVGLKDANRPVGVFLFVGPTGVGKTLLAKELSRWMFDERRGLIRLDMSEYVERHSVSRLIGSPPGYVGYGEGGQLTEAVRRHPYSVVLLDEIEKAHPEIYNTLLQLFDEGHLTDGAGRKVDFRNTVIIMTSNLGHRSPKLSLSPIGFRQSVAEEPQTENDARYRKSVEEHFAPEFMNRIDEVVLFHELGLDEIERIARLEFDSVAARVEQLGYRISVGNEVFRHLARQGYESRYGVRSLRRTLTEQIEQPLSNLILEGALAANGKVVISLDDDDIVLKVA